MKKRYAVTKKLKKLLEWCSPNKYMKEIKQLKYLTIVDSINRGNDVWIEFEEIYGGGWIYSKGFFEELLKNPRSLKEVMEIE